ncbi:MAG: cytochrome o ubiquinol oxidase subunit IV [Pseudomonas sp.]
MDHVHIEGGHAAEHGHAGADHGSLKSYAIGFFLSVILTVIPFGLLMHPVFAQPVTLAIIVAFAVVQIFVHLVFFLHMNRSSEQRWNVLAFAFTGLIIVIVVGLSLWVMYSIHTNMMAH